MYRTLAGMLLLSAFAAGRGAVAGQGCPIEGDSMDPLMRALLCEIERLSDYRTGAVSLPKIMQIPQAQLETKICDAPCDVSAAYLPRVGIYLAGNLDPLRDVYDRSALLHELVHHLQQGHAKFAQMAPCARERAKEVEAYALQNAYLESMHSARRAVFYDGEFDCDGDEVSEAAGAIVPSR